MNALDIVFGVIAALLGVGGFIIGQKKSSRDDGESNGVFRGEVNTKLEYIRAQLQKLSDAFERDREERAQERIEMRAEFAKMIEDAIRAHELIYHKEEK